MRKSFFTYLRYLTCSLLLLFISISSQARHILGVDFYYTWVSDSTYKITLVAYGDCGLTGAGYTSFEELSTSTPYVCIYDGDTYVSSVYLNIVAPSAGVNVTPVCPRELDSTNCTSDSYTIPGVTKFVYTGTYTIPHQSSVWRFIYLGYMGPAGAGAARTSAITSITGASGTFIGAIDTLNTITDNHHNSNPLLTAYANPYFCDDANDTYNPGAVDPDGDSLSFFLVAGLNSTSTYAGSAECSPGTSVVTYIAPNTAAAPLAGYSSSFSFNQLTGQIDFYANVLGRPLVVYNIEEYRHGVLIGTSQREMTFLIQTCTGSTATVISDTLTDATLGVIVDSTHYQVCANSGTVNVDIDPREPGSPNTISDSASGLPPGATFTTVGNGTATPNSTVTWNTNGVAPGDYTFYITFYDNNCPLPLIQTKAFTFTVLNPASLVNLGNDTSICVGDSLVLTSVQPAGDTYLWSTGSTADSITVKTTGTYWLSVTSTLCVARDTIHVTVNPYPLVNLGPDTTVCQDTLLTLASSYSYTSPVYLWNTGSTAASITAATTGAYWLQVTANGCPAVTDTVQITYNPLPVVSLGNNTGFCLGDSLVLTSPEPGGDTYLWSTGSTASSITVYTTGTYSLTVSNGCPASASVVITVSTPPVVNLGNDTAECQGAPLTLQSSETYTSPVYLWNTGSSASSVIATTSGTYWLQVSTNGCIGSDTINVSILYDTVDFYNHDTAICRGQYIQVTTAGDPSITYSWLPTAGIPLSATADPVITPDTSALYVMTASLQGCPDIVDSFYIDVQPVPGVYIGNNRAVCEYDTLHFDASVSPGWYNYYSYSWSPGISLDDSTKPYTVFTAGDSSELVLTVTTPAGCKGVDSAEIIVHPVGFATISGDASICPHDSVQFVAGNSASYLWQPSMYLSNSTIANPVAKPITSQAYTLLATSQYGCFDTLSVNVTVFPAALIYLGDSTTIYPGESYQINDQTNCTSFAWFPPAGLSDATIPNPVAMPAVNTNYIVYGSTENGCKTSDSIVINVSEETLLALPNAFTPGSSANNILYILKRGEATLNYYRIYNRWGQKVFETTNIENGWDGTLNGTPQPFGVYVYNVEAVTSSGRTFQVHGNVTLLR